MHIPPPIADHRFKKTKADLLNVCVIVERIHFSLASSPTVHSLTENEITLPPPNFLGDFEHVFSRALYIFKCYICRVQQTGEAVYAQGADLNGI